MRLVHCVFACLLPYLLLEGQSVPGKLTIVGGLGLPSSGTLPATCSVADTYYKTGANAGQYICTATNTWSVRSGAIVVTDPPYLADRTGTTDSYASIASAITDAAASSPPRSVFIPEGTFQVSASLAIVAKVPFICANHNSIIYYTGSADYAINATGGDSPRISGCTIHAPNGLGGILLDGAFYAVISDIFVPRGTKGDAFHFRGSLLTTCNNCTATVNGPQPFGAAVVPTNGIVAVAASPYGLNGLVLVSPRIEGMQNDGIQLDSTAVPQSSALVISGGTSESSGRYNLNVISVSGIEINGIDLESGVTKDLIFSGTSGATISGGICGNIQLSGSTDILFDGNLSSSIVADSTSSYSLVQSNSATLHRLVSNDNNIALDTPSTGQYATLTFSSAGAAKAALYKNPSDGLVVQMIGSGRYLDLINASSVNVGRFDFNLGAFTLGQLFLTQQTPASSSANCTANQFAFDTGFVYVCTATNTWKRAALVTW